MPFHYRLFIQVSQVVLVLLVLLEFKYLRTLSFGHIYRFFFGLYQFVFAKNLFATSEGRRHNSICKEDGFFWASFFTKTAEDATQHVDFIDAGILLFAVKAFFSLYALCT